jgi:hypothetical protein
MVRYPFLAPVALDPFFVVLVILLGFIDLDEVKCNTCSQYWQ